MKVIVEPFVRSACRPTIASSKPPSNPEQDMR